MHIVCIPYSLDIYLLVLCANLLVCFLYYFCLYFKNHLFIYLFLSEDFLLD